MRTFLMVLCGVAIVVGLAALILAATDSIVPVHGVITALICAAYIAWYLWQGRKVN